MPAGPRPRREPTDDWNQLRLLVTSPEQEAYEVLRPIVLFGQPIPVRAQEIGVPERTLRRRVARFDALGCPSPRNGGTSTGRSISATSTTTNSVPASRSV